MAPSEVAGSTRVAAEMMRRIFQAPGAAAVSIAAMISIFAALNGSILSGARVPYAAARDGYFFHAIGRVHPQHHTPGVSIIVLTLWACLLVLSGKYDDLFNLVIFASWILYGMTAAAVLVLRRKQPGPGSSLPHPRLSHRPSAICSRSYNPLVFNGIRASQGVRNRSWTDGSRASFLLPLEEKQSLKAAFRHRYLLAYPVRLIVLNSNQKSLNLYLVNPMNWRENRSVYWSQKRDSFVVSTLAAARVGREGNCDGCQ